MVLEKFFYHDRIRFVAVSVHRQEMMHQPAVVGMLVGQRCRMQQRTRCSDRRTAVGHIADERMALMRQMDGRCRCAPSRLSLAALPHRREARREYAKPCRRCRRKRAARQNDAALPALRRSRRSEKAATRDDQTQSIGNISARADDSAHRLQSCFSRAARGHWCQCPGGSPDERCRLLPPPPDGRAQRQPESRARRAAVETLSRPAACRQQVAYRLRRQPSRDLFHE